MKLNGFSVEGVFQQIPTDKVHEGLKCYEITDGEISAISFVEKPAHGVNFIITDEQRRIITGPVLIPNQMIYRVNPVTGEEYYVYFTKDAIARIKQKYEAKSRERE